MVAIVADSTCDLSNELLCRYQVTILPLHIRLGETEYSDGRDIKPEDIYRFAEEKKTVPKTSAPSIEEAMDVMRPLLEEGKDLVCFSISDEMSASGQVMRLAAEELSASDRVWVVNSASLSTGIGLLVIEAAEMAANGETPQAIVARMEELKPRVRASFVVDTLVYLHRGGRCSGLAAMAGGVLRLHPKILVENGKMGPGKKYRGPMANVLLAYAKEMEEDLRAAKPERVFITHSGCDEAIVASVRAYLESLHVFGEILITRAGGVISSHCGPGTLGVLYLVQ